MRYAFAAILLGLVFGCTREPRNTPLAANPALPDASVKVAVVSPKKQTLAWGIEQPGAIHAFELTPLVAKIPGFIQRVHFDLGDRVKNGQLLVKLSIPELELEVEQKAAAVEMATAEVALARKTAEAAAESANAAEPGIAVAKANVEKAKADQARWASELRRAKENVTKKLIDEQQLDETQRQASAAQAGLVASEAQVQMAAAGVKELRVKQAKAEVGIAVALAHEKVAKANVKLAAANLAYTEIRAPYDGVITARTVHTGHFLQPNSGGRVEPIGVVARLDTVRVFVEVPESQAVYAKVGVTATVRVPALANTEIIATITRSSGVLSPESRTLRVELDLPNPDGSLRPGLYCNVRIAVASSDAFVISASAILAADETTYAFRIDKGKVGKTRVQVGRTEKGNVEILGQRPVNVVSGPWLPITGTEVFASGNLGALLDGQSVHMVE